MEEIRILRSALWEKNYVENLDLGHFEAVADVIDRFIKIIKPKNIYFGEKDMQQLKIIEHFVKKNHINTQSYWMQNY